MATSTEIRGESKTWLQPSTPSRASKKEKERIKGSATEIEREREGRVGGGVGKHYMA